jgi:hypothetical protein
MENNRDFPSGHIIINESIPLSQAKICGANQRLTGIPEPDTVQPFDETIAKCVNGSAYPSLFKESPFNKRVR